MHMQWKLHPVNTFDHHKKEWDKQRQVVFDKSQELIQNLYSNMIYAEEKKKKKDKKDNNW